MLSRQKLKHAAAVSINPIRHGQKEIYVDTEEERPRTFIEAVLALLEERFPWLGSEQAEPVSGADTVDDLSDLYRLLIQERDKSSCEDAEPET